MQLKPNTPQPSGASARRRLIAACCALVGSAARCQDGQTAPAGSGLLDAWSVDTALAYHHEDGRIQAIEPIVNASKNFSDGKALNLNATFDSLPGSSPNGALTNRKPRTFASPSGTKLTDPRRPYMTAAGQLPVDPNYHDQRLAVGGLVSFVRTTGTTDIFKGGTGSPTNRYETFGLDYLPWFNASFILQYNDYRIVDNNQNPLLSQ